MSRERKIDECSWCQRMVFPSHWTWCEADRAARAQRGNALRLTLALLGVLVFGQPLNLTTPAPTCARVGVCRG